VHVAVTVPGPLITNGSGEQLTGRTPSKASNAIAVGLTEPVSQPPHELVKTTTGAPALIAGATSSTSVPDSLAEAVFPDRSVAVHIDAPPSSRPRPA